MKNIIVNIIAFFGLILTSALVGPMTANEHAALFNDVASIQKDYDRSTLDDYVAFNLYSMDREKEYFLGSVYRGYTLMHLTPEVAISKVGQQIAALRETIKRSNHTLAIDESLRRQITSLAESLKIIPFLAGGFTPELKSVWQHGIKTLDQAYNRYRQIKAHMHSRLQAAGFSSHGPETILFNNILGFASQQDKIEAYAAAFENDTQAQAWTKRKAACGATARAIVYYFNENGMLLVNMEEAMKRPVRGIDSLIDRLERNRNERNNGYIYYSDTAKLDHAFVIQQTTEGHYRILQSFIDEYTLSAELAEQTQEMNYEEIMDFSYKLKTLLESPQWNESVAYLYQELFLTLPKEGLHSEFEATPSDLSFVELPYHLSDTLLEQ